MHLGFRYGQKNTNGEKVLDFADNFGLKIANTKV